ncbi:hypothetical protein PV797_17335 [Clostridiaceae bacterium M8S5]|nr:hypothetical protein PV797_17335 [Clostridiaceae bacterium M8S5]
MSTEIIMAIILIASFLEIFTKLFSKVLEKLIKTFKLGDKIPMKLDVVFKLIWVALLLVSAVYFMFAGVEILAKFLGINLDQGLFDIFK